MIFSKRLQAASPENTNVTIETVSTSNIVNAAQTPENWLSYGGSYDEQRHSPLTQINAGNIGTLAPA